LINSMINPTNAYIIRAEGLSAGYTSKPVLRDLDLCLEAGSVTAIIGPNGSGKSTLIKCLARQLPRVSGSVEIDGRSIDAYDSLAFARQVSYLAQVRHVPMITVESLALRGRFPYLGFPRRYSREDREIAEAATRRAGVYELAKEYMPEISGGEAQKAFLSMILAQDAEIMLLDEPTTHLDIRHQHEVSRLLRELAREGKTIVVALHDLNCAIQISDNICALDKGRVAFFGPPDKLLKSTVIRDTFGVEPVPVSVNGSAHLAFPILSP